MLGTSVKVKSYRDTTSFHRRFQCGGSAAKMTSYFCTGPWAARSDASALDRALTTAQARGTRGLAAQGRGNVNTVNTAPPTP